MERNETELLEDNYDLRPISKAGQHMKQAHPWENVETRQKIDARMGFTPFEQGSSGRLGWLVNMQETLIFDGSWENGRSAIDFYFIQEDGSSFKATLCKSPYFLLMCKKNYESDVEEYIRRKYDRIVERTARVEKEDLDLHNHLLGVKRTFVQVFFRNVDDLLEVRRNLMPTIIANKKKQEKDSMLSVSTDDDDTSNENGIFTRGYKDAIEQIIDIREYDIPFVTRVAIDHDFRVGLWYSVRELNGEIIIIRQFDRVLPADPIVLAFDIETTKLPLKFPDAATDQIMMISYMIDRQGYLITNRDIVSADIEDFDYSPKPGEFDGPFTIFNEPDEKKLIQRFFGHICAVKPSVFVTYNGDFFDWPFIESRARIHGIDMFECIGWYKNHSGDYCSTYATHMDCLRWVKRDSYLPVGSQGLKAVTKSKLGYDPKELDPELMMPYASSNPHILADYSVSDAVATYYLYMKYVHPFIFSLCNIIPLAPDDVLRKGSGTLCEMLLMVEAFKANVIMPNKHRSEKGKFYKGHYLDSETYVGGHVEALESGVFRSDIPTLFRIDPTVIDSLVDDVERALKFCIEVEEKKSLADIVNFDDIKSQIIGMLKHLKNNPKRREEPLIYHLDVAAMYPNIILTNRLQPPALVSEETCAMCDFNRPESNCQRKMTWSWRGEYFAADRSEYNMIKNQLEGELFPAKELGGERRKWMSLNLNEQNSVLQKRLSEYSRKVYRRIRDSKVEEREAIVCQRENSFYVDTVRNFRDRRYEYKDKLKVWKNKVEEASLSGDISLIEDCKKMVVLMDSLQLAHKCILNSFYGYVMRKGSRWYSMEMAGIVCLTGSKIIQMARQLVERIGRPLELDTDGIWCILPKSFPENFTFSLKSGKEIRISYPCVMLNHLVHDRFTNEQYQTLVDPDNFLYEIKSENSIFFEVDGPYRAMILPASKEENKLLKKRYAVFNDNGTLAELKGFEVKRRGELKMIKVFQEEVFKRFLDGNCLESCYRSVAEVANRWLDMLFTRGKNVDDSELLEYISENRSMSKKLEEYGSQKSTSISTAKRLAELLGDKMVQDKGLSCQFIIAAKPVDAPVAERAIPVAIFSVDEQIRNHFLRKWLKDSSLAEFDVRSILDWKYYIERLGSTVQKLVTIPAAMQHVPNPVPRIPHPEWLLKKGANSATDCRQRKITEMIPKINNDVRVAASCSSENDVISTISDELKPELLDHKTHRIYSPHEDYRAWLISQKDNWRKAIKDRKSGLQITRDTNRGIASYLNNRNRSLLNCIWEVIQICETESPGIFRMWTMIGKELHVFKLQVERVFYVNCREPDASGALRRTFKILPRSLQPFYLYEFNLSEADYLHNLDNFQTFSWHQDTIGVFETNMSLEFRSLLGIGSTISTNSSSMPHKTVDSIFQLNDLQMQSAPSDSYLSGDNLNYIFMHHSQMDSRAIIGIFYVRQAKADIFVLDSRSNQSMPNMNKLYCELLESSIGLKNLDSSITGFEYPAKMDHSVTFFKDEKLMYKKVNSSLSSFKSARLGPSMILLQSLRLRSFYVSCIPFIIEYPCITITYNKIDGIFPALDWQKFVAYRMEKSLMHVRDFYTDKLMLARYAQVPVANVHDDPVLFVSDLLMSRQLIEKNVVSWFSSHMRPDLGGKEEDDNIFESICLLDPEFNVSRFYTSVCIEYEIDDLAINAILQSTFINELEGSDIHSGLSNSNMVTMDQHLSGNSIIHDTNAPSYQAFKCLKDLVRCWAKDFHLHDNQVAKVLLKNCYRWLNTPTSYMYDPSILNHVHNLMRKLLMILIGEFKRLGCKIIYATFHKVIVATSKTSVRNSLSYNDFILKSMTKKDVFAFLGIRTARIWETLLWSDVFNYVGIGVKVDNYRTISHIEGNTDVVRLMECAVVETLSPFLRDIFLDFLCEYVDDVRRIQCKYDLILESNKRPEFVGECKALLREKITPALLDIVAKIQRAYSGDENVDAESLLFPVLVGRDRKLESAALEFVKPIFHFFSYHEDVAEEVRVMRRQILMVLGIREFSIESEYRNPCESFIINNVICSYCQFSRDVDIVFDYQMSKAHSKKRLAGSWRCPKCVHEYDIDLIEETIVYMVQQSLMSYQIQDLNCTKCHMVKRENISSSCSGCAGNFQLAGNKRSWELYGASRFSPLAVLSEKNIRSKLAVLGDVAKSYDMNYLKEVIEVGMTLTLATNYPLNQTLDN